MPVIHTQRDVLKQFKADCLEYAQEYQPRKEHNDYSPEVTYLFSMYIDNLHRDGVISDSLANKITL